MQQYIDILKNNKLSIFGTGQLGINISSTLMKKGFDIECFWDTFKIGTINGTPIKRLTLEGLNEYPNKNIAFILAINSIRSIGYIKDILFQYGFTNIIDDPNAFETAIEELPTIDGGKRK